MKNKDLYQLVQGIGMCGNLTGVRFCYGLSKNANMLRKTIEELEASSKPTEAFQKYEEGRREINEKYCEKLPGGKPKTENNEYIIDKELSDIYDREINNLKEEHKEAIQAREEQVRQFKELLEEESDFVPYMIKSSYIPETITVQQMIMISPILEDSEEQK